MTICRRTFIAGLVTTPLLRTTIGQTRERRIGFGIDPATDKLLHEEYAVDRWDGSEWIDTHERRDWWYSNKGRQERRYELKHPELGF